MASSYPGLADLSDGASQYNVMEFIVRMVAGRMMTMTVVLVKAVDLAEQTVDVQPMVHQTDGDGNATPHGTVHALPYVRLSGGTSAVILEPAAGDIGLAIFSREDTSTVRSTRAPALPGSRRRYDYSDGVVLVGLLGGTPSQSLALDTHGITADTPVVLTTGDFESAGNTVVGTGTTGTFTTPLGQTVTVVAGIITDIT